MIHCEADHHNNKNCGNGVLRDLLVIIVLASCRADSWLVLSQLEMSLQSNAISHWQGANLASALSCMLGQLRYTQQDLGLGAGSYKCVFRWKLEAVSARNVRYQANRFDGRQDGQRGKMPLSTHSLWGELMVTTHNIYSVYPMQL